MGGSVRDLLLGKAPKDFDVATSATPEEVQEVFPRCRLIGRRFRLAHVRKGGALIEVATFRGVSDPDDDREQSSGRILRDNVFGTMEEDALRRDFTINALFLDPVSGEIRDYVGGYRDLADRRLRLIGDPDVRYREDPVRLLRAARFVAKLGVEPDDETAHRIPELAPLLEDVPPARLFEEICKLFMTGHGMRSMEALQRFGLSASLFPGLRRGAGRGKVQVGALLRHALENTDERVRAAKPVTPAFLFAALLWAPVEARAREYVEGGDTDYAAMMRAAEEALAVQARRTSIPRRFSAVTRHGHAVSRPRNTFRLTSNRSASSGCSLTTSMPYARPLKGHLRRLPQKWAAPAVGARKPDRSIVRGVLPAPLWPANPTTSPGRTCRLISRTTLPFRNMVYSVCPSHLMWKESAMCSIPFCC